MPKGDLYIPHGAFLKCDKGASVTQLIATPKKHNLYGIPIATETDKEPITNIPSFGVCSIDGKPCMPVSPVWQKTHDGAQKVLGKSPLITTSYCKCSKGGTIAVFLNRQEAQAALDSDKKDRVDGIPWLDNAIGNTLLGPVGALVNHFTGGHEVSEGIGRGFRKGLKGTWNFLSDDMWKADTWKGMGKLVAIGVVGYGGMPISPTARLKAFDDAFGTDLNQTHDAIGTAIATSWDQKVVHGTTAERSEVVGQTAEMVIEAVAGSKGAGLAAKGAMGGAKMALGAERVAELAETISKLRQALKLEERGNKIKGIFKVGSKEIKLKINYEDLGKIAPCFLAGTPVQTYYGLTPIENIKIGDFVFCYDFEQNKSVKNKVTNIYTNWTDRYIKIITDDGIIKTTFKHLFWIDDEKKWVTAKELKVEMVLKSLNSENKIIRTIDYVNNIDLLTFNIEVENVHNYFVGNHGILVHNNNKPSKFEITTKKPVKIYEVYDPKTGKTVYVGQTDKQNVLDRFKEHVAEGKKTGNHKSNWGKKYKVREVAEGNWDPYEAAVWEQHYINKNGGKANLQNARNEITKPKYDKFKNLHDPC